MLESIANLKTKPALLDAVTSPSRQMSASELQEQRVSFVYGSMSRESTMTKDQVRKVVLAQIGETVPQK